MKKTREKMRRRRELTAQTTDSVSHHLEERLRNLKIDSHAREQLREERTETSVYTRDVLREGARPRDKQSSTVNPNDHTRNPPADHQKPKKSLTKYTSEKPKESRKAFVEETTSPVVSKPDVRHRRKKSSLSSEVLRKGTTEQVVRDVTHSALKENPQSFSAGDKETKTRLRTSTLRGVTSTRTKMTTLTSSSKKGDSSLSSLPKCLKDSSSSPTFKVKYDMDQQVKRVHKPTSSQDYKRILERLKLSRAILGQRLPICDHKDEIVQHIDKNRVTCIHGETGCGKSTMVPLFITENFYTKDSYIKKVNIIVTQPRRLAAKSLALRVASVLQEEEVGKTVGYKISREKKVSVSTKITYVTTGYLLQMLVNKPETFSQFTHIVLDEIHERQTDNDLLSLVVKLCIKKYFYYDTKIIVMSATLQGKLFSRYFSEADVLHTGRPPAPIFVGVKMHDVQEIYLEDLKHVPLGERNYWSAEDVQAMISASRNFNGCRTGRPPPVVKEDFMKIGVKLIKAFSRTGETTLIFLPGIVEIQDMYDKLEPLERESQTEDCKFRLFVLHSQIPLDEQRAAFEEPAFDTVHVILATNIAESSLTLPKVRIVIDYGIRKQLLYDSKCKMTVLRNAWISQASACQRKGRTGRVFQGYVYRMFTKQFFNELEEFDPPEIETSPLDKLVLKIKHMGRNIAPGETVSNLLSQAVQPPELDQLEEAIERLADLGALTENDETADITLLGRVAISLPLDLLPCRLVVYGVLFGCTCDAVVMAASMSLRMEPFSLPCLMIMKDVQKFLPSLQRSFQHRVKFDEGQYSELMMLKNVMKNWLEEVRKYGYEDTSEIHNSESSQNTKKKGINSLRNKFSRSNGVHAQRLREFEHAVADIASRIIRFLPTNGNAHRQLSTLMQILYTDQEGEGTGTVFGDDDPSEDPERINTLTANSFTKFGCAQRLLFLQPSKLFAEDPMIVKSLLAAAFSPNYVSGTCFDDMKMSGKFSMVNKSERTAAAMRVHGLDPKKSLALNNILSNQNRGLFRGNHRIIREIVSLTCYPRSIEIERTGDRVFLEFDTDMPQDYSVVHDIPFSAHILNQFGDGRNKFEVPIKRGSTAHRMCQRDQITFDRPVQPYKVNWNYKHQKPQETRCEREMLGFSYSCRNPVGFMCDTRGSNFQHFAVAAKIRGKSGGDNQGCMLQDMTVLPSERDGIFAKIMMLTFTSQRIELKFIMTNTSPPCISAINISGHMLKFTNENPFSLEWLPLVNDIRREMSRVFQQQQVGNIQIPDTNLKEKVDRLFQAIRRNAERKYNFAHITNCRVANPFTARTVDDKFYILKPFDIPALK